MADTAFSPETIQRLLQKAAELRRAYTTRPWPEYEGLRNAFISVALESTTGYAAALREIQRLQEAYRLERQERVID